MGGAFKAGPTHGADHDLAFVRMLSTTREMGRSWLVVQGWT